MLNLNEQYDVYDANGEPVPYAVVIKLTDVFAPRVLAAYSDMVHSALEWMPTVDESNTPDSVREQQRALAELGKALDELALKSVELQSNRLVY